MHAGANRRLSTLAVATLAALSASTVHATVLLEFNAATSGGNLPDAVSPAWTRFGTPMVHQGSYILQDNTGDPAQNSGEYLSPTLPAGTFTRGGAPYGIEFKVRPLGDVAFVGSAWPELYLTWSDDQFNYNITVDKFHDANTSGTGDIVYGRGSFSPAITGIDWTVPHTIFIGQRGSAGTSVFDFYLDGVIQSTITDGSIARTGNFAQDAIDFGDGTTAVGDVAAEWYTVRVHNVNDPALVPEPTTVGVLGLAAARLATIRRRRNG